MYITSLELVEYRRFKLLPFKRFKAVFTKSIIVLLGTNGSGKSSVLAECSPWPADRKYYRKGGSKTIEIDHNDNQYRLISDFTGDKPKYYFYKNGDTNLNPGLTMTVYKDLVRTEFGITDDMHEILTGVKNFYNMSVAERRKWFTRMPGVDYEYAIAYFKKLKEATKATADVLKSLGVRLVKERSHLLSNDAVQKIVSDLEYERATLHNFLSQKSNRAVEKPIDYKLALRNTGDKLLESLRAHYETISNRIHVETHLGLLNDTNNNIVIQKKLKDDLVERLMEATQKYDRLNSDYSMIDVTDPESELGQLNTQMTELRSTFKSPTFLKDNGLQVGDLVSLRCFMAAIRNSEQLVDSLHGFSLTKKQIDDNYLFKLSAQQNEVFRVIRATELIISQLETELSHQEKHKLNPDTECPSCHHKWNPGYSDNSYQETSKALELNRIKHKNLTTQHKSLGIEVEHITEQLHAYTSLLGLAASNPITGWYVSELLEALFDKSKNVASVRNDTLADITVTLKMNTVYTRICDIQSVIAAKKANIDGIRKDLNETIDGLNNKINQLSLSIQQLYGRKTKLTYELNQEKKLVETIESIKKFCNYTDELIRKEGRYLLNNYLNACINELKISISVKEQKINMAQMQQSVVDKIEKEINDLNSQLLGLQAACQTLSPTNGLIAKGLSNFLHYFTQEINSTISEIASYPLEVVCGGATDEDLSLDFKLEVITNNQKDDSSPDTAQTSAGQKDIISLAFNLASMDAYKLREHPLFLDEFGVNMDHTHRNKAVRCIENLMLRGRFQQCFMVSHHSSAYSNLPNAQIIVLHKDNIMLSPDLKVDQDVIMEL